ncbi:MAG: HAMP domain-containing sensor histidine kinase [Candidatus Omnitrophota bacterium]
MTQPESMQDKDGLHLQFAALLLHDLETPFAVAKQFFKRLEEGRFDPHNPKHMQLAASIRAATLRGERILEDFLDQARNADSKLEAQPAPADIREIIADCIQVVSLLAEDKNITIRQTIDPSLPNNAEIDRRLTARIVDNFLVNALRHSPQNSIVEIHAFLMKRKQDGAATYKIMRVEILNKHPHEIDFALEDIFDPVKQVELRQQRRVQGSGLGLTFCKMAAAAQNGTVGAAKRSLDEAVFWFELPIRPHQDGERFEKGDSHGGKI